MGKGNKLYGGVKEFLADGKRDGINRMYLDSVNICYDDVNDTVVVAGINEFCNDKFKDIYETKLKDFYYGKEVIYSVKKRHKSPEKLERNLFSKDIASSNAMEACYDYNFVEHRLNEDPNLRIHGGNKHIYDHFGRLLQSLSGNERRGSCSIIRGLKGLGKSSMADDFAYMLRTVNIPVVSFSLNDLSNYLNPRSGNYDNDKKCIPEPDYYKLGCDTAKVVILDQAHGLLGGNGEGKWNRGGVQGWVFDLIERVKKRGGHVLMNFTETKKHGLEGTVERLKDEEMLDAHKKVGNGDLGDRIGNIVDYEVLGIPKEEREAYVLDMIKRSEDIGKCELGVGEILDGFMGAAYGESLTPRKIAGNIAKLEARVLEGKIKSREDIVRKIGGKKAVGRLQEGKRKNAKKGFCTKEDMTRLLTDNPYDISNVQEALEGCYYEGFRIGERVLDEEIGKIGEALNAFGSDSEEEDVTCLDYKISDTSKEALARLMFKWNNTERSLF